jgi:hypothetical protein
MAGAGSHYESGSCRSRTDSTIECGSAMNIAKRSQMGTKISGGPRRGGGEKPWPNLLLTGGGFPNDVMIQPVLNVHSNGFEELK